MAFANIIQVQARCEEGFVSTEKIWAETKILHSFYIPSSYFSSFVSVNVNITLIQDRYAMNIRNLINKVSRTRQDVKKKKKKKKRPGTININDY